MQRESFVEMAAIVAPAAGETCYAAPDLSDAREILATLRAAIEKRPRPRLPRERERMTALLVANAEIAARLAPFWSVRRNPPPLPAGMRDEVSELVAQRAIDLLRTVRSEQRIERDEVVPVISAPGGGAESRAPLDANALGQGCQTDVAQHFAR